MWQEYCKCVQKTKEEWKNKNILRMKSKLKYFIFKAAVYMVDLHRGQGGKISEGVFNLAPFEPNNKP